MDAGRRRILGSVVTLAAGVGLVYSPILVILALDPSLAPLLVGQLFQLFVVLGAGLILFGEGVWHLARASSPVHADAGPTR